MLVNTFFPRLYYCIINNFARIPLVLKKNYKNRLSVKVARGLHKNSYAQIVYFKIILYTIRR